MKTKAELKNEIETYVQEWIDGHEEDTFIKDEYGLYWYTAGATSLNLKAYFERLLEDFIEDKFDENNHGNN
jgi:hypothetical protein